MKLDDTSINVMVLSACLVDNPSDSVQPTPHLLTDFTDWRSFSDLFKWQGRTI